MSYDEHLISEAGGDGDVMSGMADVVANHYINYSGGAWKCTSLDCSFSSVRFDAAMGHVAAQLAAAGFGPVRA